MEKKKFFGLPLTATVEVTADFCYISWIVIDVHVLIAMITLENLTLIFTVNIVFGYIPLSLLVSFSQLSHNALLSISHPL